MRSRGAAIESIVTRHGQHAIYVASTGYVSRAVYDLYPGWTNILYMQGSMGLAPAIGLGIARSADVPVVVISGDGALLMHLGVTHTIRDQQLDNLFLYVLDNGCHESVGGQPCAGLVYDDPGATEIIKITCDGKPPRVVVSFEQNRRDVEAAIRMLSAVQPR